MYTRNPGDIMKNFMKIWSSVEYRHDEYLFVNVSVLAQIWTCKVKMAFVGEKHGPVLEKGLHIYNDSSCTE